MTETRLRARSVSEIVDASFQLYRQNAAEYIAAGAITYVPWLIIQLVMVLWRGPTVTLASTGAIVATVVTFVGTLIAYALMTGVIARLGSDAYLGRRSSLEIGEAIRDVLPRVGALIGAGILKYLLIAVAVLAIVFVGGIVAAATPGVMRAVLMVGLFVLCFVGAIYVGVRYFATSTSIVLEGQTAIGSFSRSLVLSKGRAWHIFLTLLLVWIIYVVGALASYLVAMLASSPVLLVVITTAYTIVAYPLMGLAETVLYYDTRIRAEGFDIEVMAQGLGSPAAGA
jgi:hypothetical protein